MDFFHFEPDVLSPETPCGAEIMVHTCTNVLSPETPCSADIMVQTCAALSLRLCRGIKTMVIPL